MYLVIAEEEQGAVVHQFPGFSMFSLRHVPEGRQKNKYWHEITSSASYLALGCIYFTPVLQGAQACGPRKDDSAGGGGR